MNNVVTLTTKPDKAYGLYHHRMPLLIPPNEVDRWLCASSIDTTDLLEHSGDLLLKVTEC
ncbi:SOS response-associated peptidase [Vibrio penaeicida]|nr:SOS response-associated peptidase [Vibrio penaeicida]